MIFEKRIILLREIVDNYIGDNSRYEIIPQTLVKSSEEAQKFYDEKIELGFEGIVLMDGRKKYKKGRVTIKEHIGFKKKPVSELDLLILGTNERMKNLNKSETNELGNSYKKNTVDAKEPTGIASTFTCQLPNGETTDVTITGDEASRRDIWKNREDYIGKYAVVKSMAYGVKDKLRHARLIGIKDAVEK